MPELIACGQSHQIDPLAVIRRESQPQSWSRMNMLETAIVGHTKEFLQFSAIQEIVDRIFPI